MALKDQLTQAASTVGAIERIPGAEGASDVYKTSSGAFAEKVGDNRFRVPIITSVDADGSPGRGSYWAEYDSSGNLVREPYYQQTTNHDWSGLVAFAATSLGAFALSQAGLGAMSGVGTGAPISSSQIAAIGAAATPADLAAAVAQVTAGGAVPAGLSSVLAKVSPALLSAAKSFLPSGVQGIVDGILNNSGNLLDLAGGLLSGDQLIGASNTAANAYNDLGNQVANDYYSLFDNIDKRTQGIGNDLNTRYQNLGTTASGMLGDLATQAKGDYTNLGTAAAGVYNGIAGGTRTAYDNLLQKVENTTEKFTPWNVTTNVGSTNKGVFTPTSGTQNVSDQATAAAGSSFGAANAIDVNNLAAQKYGQQQAMLAPYDAKALAELRANLAATGRTGIASNATGQPINPELAAYYLSKNTRDQGLLANADQAALNVRQGLIGQGAAASAVPINIGAQGLQQVAAGVNAGATQASTNNQLGQMLGSLGAQGINATTQAQLHGADQTLPIFSNAVSVPLGLQRAGIDTMLSQGNKGLDALTGQLNYGTQAAVNLGNKAINNKYDMFVRSIGQRYNGNFHKAALLAKVLSSMGGMTSKAAQAANGGDVGTLTQELLKAGMSPDKVAEIITGGTGGGDLGSGTYSIWSPDGSPDMGGGTGAGETTYGSLFGLY